MVNDSFAAPAIGQVDNLGMANPTVIAKKKGNTQWESGTRRNSHARTIA